MSIVEWITTHKLLTFLVVVSGSLFIATTTLGVQKANLTEDLENCEGKLSTANTDPPTTEMTTAPTTTPTPTPTPEPSPANYRLPTQIRPDIYDLTFYPDLVTGLFTGKMIATVNIDSLVPEIIINSNGLAVVGDITVDGVKVTHRVDVTYERIVLSKTGGFAKKDGVKVVIEFSGDMKDRLVGLYVSQYKKSTGEMISIATSKFEPTYARQAYPCFDEPNMKAKFIVHLFKPLDKEYISLSNMPIKDSETQSTGVMVNFEESVPMSTYLSCFIVSDFKYKTARFGDNVELRVYSSLEQLSKTDYALGVGVKAMNFYEGYFDIKYPLPKLDMVAIPDFVSGAMEHWGLVTYRETALLYSEEISSSANKQRVATVVAHELAHSWFGNLVTMDWWNDLWLNEGFASYIEYKGVHAAEETWQMMNQFLIDDLHPVMVLDATLGSHAIVKNVLTPNQITEIFDTISYNKGAAVLRMLEGAVTDTIFQAGVKAYLLKFSLGNAVTQDFWDEMNKVTPTDLDVTAMMNTWTKQMGYPVLSVKKEGNKYTLIQSRFLTNSKATGEIVPSEFDYKWTIPVNYITDIDATPKQAWFDWKTDKLELTIDGAWVKFNPEQVGYYRVNYSPTEWELMAQNIKGMSVADRSHLLEESFRIAESGLIAYSVPLDLSKYLVEEKEYIPWSVASTMFRQINKLLFNSPSYDLFKKHVLKLVDPIYKQLGWTEVPTEGHLEKRTRVAVLSLACSMGNTHCIAEANKQFKDWLQNPKELSQDLRSIIYSYGMESATQDEWEQVLDKFVKEIDANEKTKLMGGLTSVNSPSLLQRMIRFAEDPQNIRNQDYFSCIQAIAANPSGTALVWDYVRENWTELVKRFGINERYLGRMIPSITSRFTTDIKYDEITAFFAKHTEAGAGAAARIQALEAVKNNIRWVETYEESITTWLNANA